ncbi:MAG TPA: A/G-specific adenine glycosylase [Verrucomicrobiae bacterium]|nr:A/G-specific adenine glycosylase [Verrucomicrobiae bacterium]
MSKQATPLLQKNLLAWYGREARDLPWRRTQDPYKIWVSEIMLQQTQVATVIDYYNRWMRRFPDVKSLADAPLADVLEHWAGLGYYRRARMLHQAAQLVARSYGGRLPHTAAALNELPGIGRYTAAAIASIAFGESSAVLDGNVIRILTRLFALPDDVGSPKTIAKLWDIAQELIKDQAPGDFNQAMMELGATVCFPKNPSCGVCPVADSCKARAKGDPTAFPFKKRKEIIESLTNFALVCRKDGRVLLRQQPEEGRWGGLWMFPFWAKREHMVREFDLKAKRLKHLMTVNHGFTKYRISLKVYEHPSGGAPGSARSKWVPITDLSKYAFPSPHQRIVREILKTHAGTAS